MTENEGATASSRFPSFFYNHSFSPYSARSVERGDLFKCFYHKIPSCKRLRGGSV